MKCLLGLIKHQLYLKLFRPTAATYLVTTHAATPVLTSLLGALDPPSRPRPAPMEMTRGWPPASQLLGLPLLWGPDSLVNPH